jgi:hypothetical protein
MMGGFVFPPTDYSHGRMMLRHILCNKISFIRQMSIILFQDIVLINTATTSLFVVVNINLLTDTRPHYGGPHGAAEFLIRNE